MQQYEAVVTQVTIRPKREPIFSENATDIQMVDEAGGCFVRLRQSTGVDGVSIDVGDWEMIKEQVDRMLQECNRVNATLSL